LKRFNKPPAEDLQPELPDRLESGRRSGLKQTVPKPTSSSPSLLRQVIYKKFNIACPLEVFGNFSVSAVSEDSCTTKYFTINQEVRPQSTRPIALEEFL